jgi:large subunit ribosomal protein L2
MKYVKPTSAGRRNMTFADYSVLTKKNPEKSLLISKKNTGGRGAGGRITLRFRGSGNKRLYRMIDFGQEKINIPGRVVSIEYDPYRSGFIALVQYKDGEKRYILAPDKLTVNQDVIISEKAEPAVGNRIKLKNIPVGTIVYNIELQPNQGGKIVRSAGSGAQILSHDEKYTLLKMPSKEERKVLGECFASIGMVSKPEHRFIIIGKAGRVRAKGERPHVRGSVMNPCDHPHGGGEGRTGIGLKHPKTPWGKPAKGVKTRKRKKWTNKLILRKRKVIKII